MADSETPAKRGEITFIESHRPPLIDGQYEITVEQTVRNKNANAPDGAKFDETYRDEKKFQVRGERFSLNSTEIETVFPPENNQGEYKNVLPHIVFNRTTLPWERTAGDSNESSWLALLLFDVNDSIPDVRTIMVGDLQRESFPHTEGGENEPSSLPDNAVSYPDLRLGYGEQLYDPCHCLDISVETFNRVAPGIVDLPWLSSSRTVTPEDSNRMALNDKQELSIETSAIVCNRLPEPNTTCTAFLVSLEGMASYLPTSDNYTPSKITLPNGKAAAAIRLVVLHSWSYESVDPEQSFSGLLKALDKNDRHRVFSINDDSEGTAPSDGYVRNALKLGYTPINHHTRQGCKTVSWYRSPMVPFNVPATIFVAVAGDDPPEKPIETADQAVQYNPDTGMMDITYAAAWQIGRLLALQDKGFSEALYNWKREATIDSFTAFERSVLERELGETLSVTSSDHKKDPLIMHHAEADFIKSVIGPVLMNKLSVHDD